MSDSPIFIVGCPRSGTKLLRDLLRSHPRLAFPEESHFISELYQGYGDPRNEREARRLAARILNLYWVRSWGLQVDLSAFADDRSYRQIVSRIYEEWARKQNKARWGDKTPHYVTSIPILLEIFPSAKVIHIYRDGRDVALSWLRVRFGPRNLFSAARAWKSMVSTGRQVGALLPAETYLEVRYESLLGNPSETMKAVCAFLDEQFTDAVLRPTVARGASRHRPLIGEGRPTRPPSNEIVSANIRKWKKSMSLPDRILFESVAGDLLETLGYETEGVKRRIGKPEQVMWKAHDLFLWLLTRVNTTGNHRLLTDFLTNKWANVRQWLRAAAQ
ncbi:MAG TPA: sulfotransferase [Candidatus Binatia bacterium]|jgi:hypothetical protein